MSPQSTTTNRATERAVFVVSSRVWRSVCTGSTLPGTVWSVLPMDPYGTSPPPFMATNGPGR